MIRHKATRRGMFIGLLNTPGKMAQGSLVSAINIIARCPEKRAHAKTGPVVSVIRGVSSTRSNNSMVTLRDVATFLVSMQISISSLQTHIVNRCGRSRHLARKLSLRRKRSSPNVFEMAASEPLTSIILIKLIRVSFGTSSIQRRFKLVVIVFQLPWKQFLRDFLVLGVIVARKAAL